MGELARRVRAKHPDAYHELSDDELEQRILRKYPDVVQYKQDADEKNRIAAQNELAKSGPTDKPAPPPKPEAKPNYLAPGFEQFQAGPLTSFLAGIPQGLVEFGTGAAQTAADVLRMAKRTELRREAAGKPDLMNKGIASGLVQPKPPEQALKELEEANLEQSIADKPGMGVPTLATIAQSMREPVGGNTPADVTMRQAGANVPMAAGAVFAPLQTAAALGLAHVGEVAGEHLAPTISEVTSEPMERVRKLAPQAGGLAGMIVGAEGVPESLRFSVPEAAMAADSLRGLVEGQAADFSKTYGEGSKPAGTVGAPDTIAGKAGSALGAAAKTAVQYVKEHPYEIGATALGAAGGGFVGGLAGGSLGAWTGRQVGRGIGKISGKAADIARRAPVEETADAARATAGSGEANKPVGARGASDVADEVGPALRALLDTAAEGEQAYVPQSLAEAAGLERQRGPRVNTQPGMAPSVRPEVYATEITRPEPPSMAPDANGQLPLDFNPQPKPPQPPQQLSLDLPQGERYISPELQQAAQAASAPAPAPAPAAPAPAPLEQMLASALQEAAKDPQTLQALLESVQPKEQPLRTPVEAARAAQARLDASNALDLLEQMKKAAQPKPEQVTAPEPPRPAITEATIPKEMERQQKLAEKAKTQQAARESQPGYAEAKAKLKEHAAFVESYNRMIQDGFPEKTARAAGYKAAEAAMKAEANVRASEGVASKLEASVKAPEAPAAKPAEATAAPEVPVVTPKPQIASKAVEPAAKPMARVQESAPSVEPGKTYKVGDQLPNGKYVLEVDEAGRVVEVGKNPPKNAEISGPSAGKAQAVAETPERKTATDRVMNMLSAGFDRVKVRMARLLDAPDVADLNVEYAPGAKLGIYRGKRALKVAGELQGIRTDTIQIDPASLASSFAGWSSTAGPRAFVQHLADAIFAHEPSHARGLHDIPRGELAPGIPENRPQLPVEASAHGPAAKSVAGERFGDAMREATSNEENRFAVGQDILRNNPEVKSVRQEFESNLLNALTENDNAMWNDLTGKGAKAQAPTELSGTSAPTTKIPGGLPRVDQFPNAKAWFEHGRNLGFTEEQLQSAWNRHVSTLPEEVKTSELGGARPKNGGEYVNGQEAVGRAGEARDPQGAGGGKESVVPKADRGQDLEGLPAEVQVGGETKRYGAYKPAQDSAKAYVESQGRKYNPPKTYAKVDPVRAKKIADAFDQMKHDPNDPKVKASYNAMIKETLAQYQQMLKDGITVEFIPTGEGSVKASAGRFDYNGKDPYCDNPRNMIEDVAQNKHMWVYPTDLGFGAGEMAAAGDAHPMLRSAGVKISGRDATVNDVFRAVHDYYGHVKEGVGFRASGEENAWRSHSGMYSNEARPAMTTETRGQNSWLNYGPHGELNRNAKTADTVFAEQKVGLLPDWATTEAATEPISWVPPEKQAKNLDYENKALGKVEKRHGVKPPQAPLNKQQTVNGVKYGPVTPAEWLDRVKGQIKEGTEDWANARHWYSKVREVIQSRFPDLSDHDAGTIAFGITQSGTSPTGGVLALLRAIEQHAGKTRIKAPGTELTTNMLKTILEGGKQLTKGIGAKLSDLLDPLVGNEEYRSWTGPEGQYKPAAIDRHVLTDVGYITEAANARLGNVFKPDVYGDVPTDAQYLHSLKFYNDVAEYLNKNNVDGGGWTPAQAQAIGWTAIRKAQGLKGEGPMDMIRNNTRRVLAEVTGFAGDSPIGQKVAQALEGKELSPEVSTKITRQLARPLVDRIAKATQVRIEYYSEGQGGYVGGVNDNLSARVLGSPEAINDFAHALGRAAGQTEVLSVRPSNLPGAEPGLSIKTSADLGGQKGQTMPDIWKRAVELDKASAEKGLFDSETVMDKIGYTRILNRDGSQSILILRGKYIDPKVWAKSEERIASLLNTAIKQIDPKAETSALRGKYETQSAFNDWSQAPNGEAYDAYLKGRGDKMNAQLAETYKWFENAVLDIVGGKKTAAAPAELSGSAPPQAPLENLIAKQFGEIKEKTPPAHAGGKERAPRAVKELGRLQQETRKAPLEGMLKKG